MKEITAFLAEKIFNRRLDRRRRYAVYKRKLHSLGHWTETCSGCHETVDGHETGPVTRDRNGLILGGGCSECGYTGKVRQHMWLPHD